MVASKGSSTCRHRYTLSRSSTGASGPGLRLWAFGTLDGVKPLGSCVSGIRRYTYGDASEAASTTSSVWSRSESKASAAHVDGTSAPGCCSGAGRSDHAGGCLALDLGCSKRKVIVPLPGGAGHMRSPWQTVFGSELCRISDRPLVTSSDLYTASDPRESSTSDCKTYLLSFAREVSIRNG